MKCKISESDVINHGNEIGYALDTPSSWGYSTANNLSGRGVYNNEYAPPTEGHALTTNWDLGSHNEGLRKRMEKHPWLKTHISHVVYPRVLLQ